MSPAETPAFEAVKTALAQERGALEAEYASREKQLREKIAVLEQQMKAK